MSDSDFLVEFVAEAREHLEQAENCLLRLARNANDQDAIQACFRALHTVKGNAGFLGQTRIQALAHAAEHLLDRIRNRRVACGADQVDALLQAVSRLGAILTATVPVAVGR